MKGKIKKYVALVLSVQQLLCGCSATELEDRCFPMMAVVDEKDGQISFGYGFPKLSQKAVSYTHLTLPTSDLV